MKSRWTEDEDVQTVHHQLSPECPHLRSLARRQVEGNYAQPYPSTSLLNQDRNPAVVTAFLPTQAEIEQETVNGVNLRNPSIMVARNLDCLHVQTHTARHCFDFRASIRCAVGRILSQIQRNLISMSTDSIDRHSSFSSYQQLSSHRRHNSIFFRECFGFLLRHWHGSTRLSVQVLFSGPGLASFTLLTMRHLALTGQLALRHSGSSVDFTLNLQQVVRIFPGNVTVLFLQAANHRRPQIVGLNLSFFAAGSVFIVYNLL
ncbi:hypothetical protein BgiBS90_033588 [Biomphalaria glabrata]|nr:hypothetical protein BgiBS90_033588 [Biomphalaria glabrata]